MTRPDWLVLVNPMAGYRTHAVERTRDTLRRLPIDSTMVVPRGVEMMREAVRAGMAEGRRRFAAVGGDGTVNVVVDTLLEVPWETPPVIAVLPAGSGSDLARTFQIPQTIEDAARTLLDDRVAPLDAGEIRGSWGVRHFVNVAETGLTAAVLRRALSMPKWLGFRKYHISLLLTFPKLRLADVSLKAGGEEIDGRSLLVIFANGRYFAGGWKIAPGATVSDGLFDIQVFDATKKDVPRLWWLAKNGRHVDEPAIRRIVAESFTLHTSEAWPVEADGEYLGEGPIDGRMRRAALHISV